jgi:hypothetical protein
MVRRPNMPQSAQPEFPLEYEQLVRKLMRDAAAVAVLTQIQNRAILAPPGPDTVPYGFFDNIFAARDVVPKLAKYAPFDSVFAAHLNAGRVTNKIMPCANSDDEVRETPHLFVVKSNDPTSVACCNQSSIEVEIVHSYLSRDPLERIYPNLMVAASILTVSVTYLERTEYAIIAMTESCEIQRRALVRAANSRTEVLLHAAKDALLLIAKMQN